MKERADSLIHLLTMHGTTGFEMQHVVLCLSCGDASAFKMQGLSEDRCYAAVVCALCGSSVFAVSKRLGTDDTPWWSLHVVPTARVITAVTAVEGLRVLLRSLHEGQGTAG